MKKKAIHHPLWVSGKRYYDLKSYFANRFGDRVYKISLDAGFTCPNRDGSRAHGGCTYCDGRGSVLRQQGALPSVTEQLENGKVLYARLRKAMKFIAYFQTFTNTYAPVERLQALYDEALAVPNVVGLAIGTRPDAVSREVMDLLAGYAEGSEVWLEYGLQSMHDQTLASINRGHDRRTFEEAVQLASEYGIKLCVHVILGLPGESPEMMLETAAYVARLPIQGIKLHSLLLLKGTPLYETYRSSPFPFLNRAEYARLVVRFLEKLPPRVVVQRLTAEGYRDIFTAPAWARNKLQVLQSIFDLLEEEDTWQGKLTADHE
ncbi:MAG: TIGR01212 family radical SAM protein [Deltaproteobacteria bacterium]|nr:TIGR01212 family radical SAM protein [Candidatus Anaeroferrophillus wilburensis]MBN2889964.1 TIGR01212 family radical SAM protein [Deltaproteobacteria bacterium]